MKETQNNYYWNEDTINHFKEVSNTKNALDTIKEISKFIESDCELQEGENLRDLIIDLINKVYTQKAAVIDVYESPTSSKIIKVFYDMMSFEYWVEHEKPVNFGIYADQVAINGQMLLDWEELENYS